MREYNLQGDNSSTLNPDRSTSKLASGTVMVLAGQMSFVLCGYLLHSYLSRAITPLTYGIYGVMMNVLTWTESALQNGVPWAIRKFLPEDPESSATILRAGLKWQMVVGVLLYIGTMFLAPWFSGAIRDPGLTFYVRLALTDIVWMALYTFYRAALNGFHMFAAQGASMTAYAVGKLAFSVLFVALGYSLNGALLGNVLGSVTGWLVAFVLVSYRLKSKVDRRTVSAEESAQIRQKRLVTVPQGRNERQYNGKTILSFALPTVLFTLAGTFLTTVGLLGVKALVADGEQVAYYTAANNLAAAPTILLVAFSLTIFPYLAGSIAAQNWGLTSAYIRSGVRYLALVLIPGIFLVWGLSPLLLNMIYPPNYIMAAPLFNLLIISTGLYSLYMVFANAILAEGRVFLALSIPSALVPLSLLTTWYLTGRFRATGAAWAAVLTTGLAALVAGGYVLRRFAVRLNWVSLARISLASIALYGLIRCWAPRGVLLLPYLLFLGAMYLVLLFLLGEYKMRDLQRWGTEMGAIIEKRY